jgi:uncharacterized DUF497 family protein
MGFFDPNALTKEDAAARGTDSAGRILVVVYTHRGENLRLISARAATGRKRNAYEKGI